MNITKFRGMIGFGFGKVWFICRNSRLLFSSSKISFVSVCFFLLFSKPVSLFLIAQIPVVLRYMERRSKLHWPGVRPRCLE